VKRLSKPLGWANALDLEGQITLRRPEITVRHPQYPAPMILRRRTSDLSVFLAIFDRDEFGWQDAPMSNVIVDGGANIGLGAVYFARRFPQARIIAVEPGDDNLEMVRRNCAHLPQVEIVQAGLWSRDSRLVVVDDTAQSWSLTCRETTEDEEGSFPGLSLDTLFEQHGIERCGLLKLDIEGAESEIFETPGAWLERVDAILVETHSDLATERVLAACPETEWSRSKIGDKIALLNKAATS